MRFFNAKTREQERDGALFKVVGLLLSLGLALVWAFSLDWPLGVFILGAFAALGFGAWRVSKGR